MRQYPKFKGSLLIGSNGYFAVTQGWSELPILSGSDVSVSVLFQTSDFGNKFFDRHQMRLY